MSLKTNGRGAHRRGRIAGDGAEPERVSERGCRAGRLVVQAGQRAQGVGQLPAEFQPASARPVQAGGEALFADLAVALEDGRALGRDAVEDFLAAALASDHAQAIELLQRVADDVRVCLLYTSPSPRD